jgi:hypothetical protein
VNFMSQLTKLEEIKAAIERLPKDQYEEIRRLILDRAQARADRKTDEEENVSAPNQASKRDKSQKA